MMQGDGGWDLLVTSCGRRNGSMKRKKLIILLYRNGLTVLRLFLFSLNGSWTATNLRWYTFGLVRALIDTRYFLHLTLSTTASHKQMEIGQTRTPGHEIRFFLSCGSTTFSLAVDLPNQTSFSRSAALLSQIIHSSFSYFHIKANWWLTQCCCYF